MSEWHTIDRTGVKDSGGIHMRGVLHRLRWPFSPVPVMMSRFLFRLKCCNALSHNDFLSCCQKSTRSVTCVRDGWSPSEWLLTEVPRRGCGAHPARVLNRLHCFGSNLGGGACRLMTEWRVLVLAPLTKMQRCSSWMHLVSPSL